MIQVVEVIDIKILSLNAFSHFVITDDSPDHIEPTTKKVKNNILNYRGG